MYKIQYQKWDRLALCYFNDYSVAKKCYEELKEKNPETIVELVTITTINSYEEFVDRVNMKLN